MQFTSMLGRTTAGEEDNADDSNSRNRAAVSRKDSSHATTTITTSSSTTVATGGGHQAGGGRGGSSNNNSTAGNWPSHTASHSVSRSGSHYTQRASHVHVSAAFVDNESSVGVPSHACDGPATSASSLPPSKETSAVVIDEVQSTGELEGIFRTAQGTQAADHDGHVSAAPNDMLVMMPEEMAGRPDSPYCVEVETGMVMTLVHPCMEPVHVRLLQLQRAIRHEATRLHGLRRRAQQFHQNAYPAIALEAMGNEEASPPRTATPSRERSQHNSSTCRCKHHSNTNNSHGNSKSVSSSSSSSSSNSRSVRSTVSSPSASHVRRRDTHCAEHGSRPDEDNAEAKLLRDCMTSIYLGQAIPKPTLAQGAKERVQEQQQQQQWSVHPSQHRPAAQSHAAHVEDSLGDDTEEEDGSVRSTEEEEEEEEGKGTGRQRRNGLQPLSSQELAQLRQSSQRLAELYRQRGVYLRRMDVLLRQHANCNERWESNEERTTCYRCQRPFSALTRRHHCRRCGRLCCAECSRHFGKKQDTSCLPPSRSEDSVATLASPALLLHNDSTAPAHHVATTTTTSSNNNSRTASAYRPHSVVRTEYAVRLTEADTGEDPEERYDTYTYPNAHRTQDERGAKGQEGKAALPKTSQTRRQNHAKQRTQRHASHHTTGTDGRPIGIQQQRQEGNDTTANATHSAAVAAYDSHVDGQQARQHPHASMMVTSTGTIAAPMPSLLVAATQGGLKHHEWVRICTTCYNNCLRARKTDILKRTKNANRCILDDGYYYFYVLTAEELRCLGTLMDKPDSLRKQVELQSCALLERSADYIVGVPSYGTRMLTSAAQQTPQVLRTLGSMSLYAARRARKAATDCVETYLVTRETSTRAARQSSHVDAMADQEVRASSDDEAAMSPAEDGHASDESRAAEEEEEEEEVGEASVQPQAAMSAANGL